MSKESILIVEDDEDILGLTKNLLISEGYDVDGVTSGEMAIDFIKSFLPDLVLLDLMLPGINGIEVCKILKSNPQTANIPIIMLTSKGAEEDIIQGLDFGADDYIVKSPSYNVLIARIRTVLRRRNTKEAPVKKDSSVIKMNNVVIDPNRYTIFIEDKNVELSPTEFKLLYYLASKPGWVFTRNQILEEIRGDDSVVNDRSIDVSIAGLRKKLGTYSKCIETVHGVGYSFTENNSHKNQ